MRWRSSTQARCWNRWLEYVWLMKSSRVAMSRMMRSLEHRCFSRWHEYVAEQRDQRRMMDNVLLRWQQNRVLSALCQWREWNREMQGWKRGLSKAVMRWRSSTQARCWNRWLEVVSYRRAERIADRYCVKFTVRRAFSVWAALSSLGFVRRLNVSITQRTLRTLSRCFGTWRLFTRHAAHKKAALGFHWLLLARNSFCAWTSFAVRSKSSRSLVSAAYSRIRRQRLAKAFSGILRYSAWSRSAHAFSSASAVRATLRLGAFVLRQWRALTVRHVKARQLSVLHMARVVQLCFGSLRMYGAGRRQQLNQYGQCDLFRRGVVLRLAVRRLQSIARQRVSTRAKFAFAWSYSTKALCCSVWRKWQQYVRSRREANELSERGHRFFFESRLRSALRWLRQVSAQQERLRTLRASAAR